MAARNDVLASRAAPMRAFPTASDAALWRELSGRGLGVALRRQAVIGGRYIADFIAPEGRLILEIDGGYHARRRRADARRDDKLARLGYRVLRLEAELVERQLEQAVELVREALAQAL
jgi:very-short-patch-repair endonuclease